MYLRQLKYSSCPSAQSKMPLHTSRKGMHVPSWHWNWVLKSHAGQGLPVGVSSDLRDEKTKFKNAKRYKIKSKFKSINGMRCRNNGKNCNQHLLKSWTVPSLGRDMSASVLHMHLLFKFVVDWDERKLFDGFISIDDAESWLIVAQTSIGRWGECSMKVVVWWRGWIFP